MSTVEADVEVASPPVPNKDLEITERRDVQVGGLPVRRMLPLRLRRSVGAWCFIDRYGPADTDGTAGMQVPPHPRRRLTRPSHNRHRLLADATVDALTQQVGVAVVPGVLLDHVHEQLTERDWVFR